MRIIKAGATFPVLESVLFPAESVVVTSCQSSSILRCNLSSGTKGRFLPDAYHPKS